MKSLMLLWKQVAEELGDSCSVSTTHDYKTLVSRVEHEGLAFLGISLPSFGKDFEKSLDQGGVAPDAFPGFRRRAGLPLFLRGFLELVFDPFGGSLLDEPSINAIHAIRQLTLLFGKMEMLASPRRERAAMGAFIETEREVKRFDACRTASQEAEFRQVSSLLWADVLTRVDFRLYEEQRQAGLTDRDPDWPYVRPKHGPGATADRLKGNRKFEMREWTQRLEEVFPSGEYLLPSWRYFTDLHRVDIREPGTERPVRVISVPKTLKTPRLIAIEPSYMQFMQQGLKQLLVDAIKDDKFLGCTVGFDDQWRNHRLARQGSLTGEYATLDLSEASDRVSNQLVRLMLARHPHFHEAVDATRSRKADVPGNPIIRLAKFASMGSALTFPIEAMVFTTIVFVGIQRSKREKLTRGDVKSLASKVRVYGDDIIVPVEYTQSVIQSLEDFGLKVNVNKSFFTGRFRESCGKEYYAGEDVSVVRVRKVVVEDGLPGFPSSRKHVLETESFVNLRNRFYLSGLWRTAAWFDERIGPLLGGYYPTVSARPLDPDKDPEARSRGLARYSLLDYQVDGVHSDLHTPLVRAWVVQSRSPDSPLNGVGALLKVLAPRTEPFEDKHHLERAGRPDADRSKLKLRVVNPE